jgi:hypothetical protein
MGVGLLYMTTLSEACTMLSQQAISEILVDMTADFF